eukprot:CAMPEP_0202477038 /NCGR_PEP_ID=MMETSP1360-20130828/93737_1 /ASSEMBLY_ACC=CAM_ASM_000848 /TAXON_ID=515479 /ORGANISM="Licmophora paradoxa, Strain CCMP2313" /LENGTH=121 /DNA_ID=CAMNT_0049104269 /DNA_START=1241 /DNA_END=1606 /DNA_ORIENTATION=-
MKLGGLAIFKDGAIWTQSFVATSENTENLPDYVMRLGFDIHDPTNTHDQDTSKTSITVCMRGVPIQFYHLPSKDTILHRISMDQNDEVWFTELGADRIGTIRFEDKLQDVSSNNSVKLIRA